jgi:fructose-1,6-bisphosphatase/inositol monophosphatase family enzyme
LGTRNASSARVIIIIREAGGVVSGLAGDALKREQVVCGNENEYVRAKLKISGPLGAPKP